MGLCDELVVWVRALVALSVPWLGVEERHSAVLPLQGVETLFPALARRIAFLFLAHGAVRCRDGNCMHNLAVCYVNGVGTFEDLRKGFLWYLASSRAGCPSAFYNLGYCYYNGWGTAVDDERAFRSFLMAFELGFANAACYLGLMYSYGEYVGKSPSRTFLWYRIGALRGDANAQFDFSKCLRNGEGCAADRNAADVWLFLSAENGSEEACESLQADGRIGALRGDANAQFDFAKRLQNGEGCAADRNAADVWLFLSAENGSGEARKSLRADGRIGVLRGDANAQYGFSKCLRNGEGCAADRNAADVWLFLSAENGSEDARGFLRDEGRRLIDSEGALK